MTIQYYLGQIHVMDRSSEIYDRTPVFRNSLNLYLLVNNHYNNIHINVAVDGHCWFIFFSNLLDGITLQVIFLSMGIGTPKILRYSERSKPQTTDRRVPRRRQTAKWWKQNSQSIGIQQAQQAADTGQTHPRRWQMNVGHKR